MFLPFHDDNPTQRTAFVTYAIVAANVLCFVWFLQLPTQQQHEFTLHHGFIPARMTKLAVGQPVVVKEPILLRDRRGGLWQADRAVRLPADRNEILLSPLTCMFLHAGWVHLLSNMWFLWLFGNNIEDRLGHVVFLLFYVLGGLLGSGCHWLINPDSLAPTIGASGAVAAVLGAYAITWPWARIHTLVFLIVFITIVDLPALGVLGAWFLIQLMEGQGQLGLNVAGGVAWWAHVGGFVAGMVLMPLLSRLPGTNRLSTERSDETTRGDQHDRIIDTRIMNEDDRQRHGRV